MKSGITFAISFMAILLANGAAQAVQSNDPCDSFPSEVKLRAEKSVHKAKSPGGVKFTLTNQSSQTLYFSSISSFEVLKGNTSVYAPVILVVPTPLHPGESRSWNWNKKDLNGKWAPPGTYTIKVGPIYTSEVSVKIYRSIDIALTPTGTLAGTSMFPLAVGNEWIYTSGGLSTAGPMTVAKKNGIWFQVTNLVGQARWARLSPSTKPMLYVVSKLYPPTVAKPLFKFKLPLGTIYNPGVGTVQKIEVIGVKETVVTPAGTFKNCYSLSVSGSPYKSFTFAPGVGLVRYTKLEMMDIMVIYSLRRAKVKGSDGIVYRIGQD